MFGFVLPQQMTLLFREQKGFCSFLSYFIPIREQASVFVYFHLCVSYLTIELLCDFGEATSSFLVCVFTCRVEVVSPMILTMRDTDVNYKHVCYYRYILAYITN